MGWNAYLSKSKTVQRIVHGYEMFLDLLEFYSAGQILPFNEAAALTAMELKRQHKVRFKPMDLRIAAIALTNSLTLVTRNSVDFERVPDLRIEDWTK